MKVYLHCDYIYQPDNWYKRFEFILKSKNIDYKLIDLLRKDPDEELEDYEDGDFLIGRFGHLEFDKNRIKPIYKDLHEKFKGKIFPKYITYFYYDEKDKQIELFKKEKYPAPKNVFLENNSEIKKIKENCIDFPAVMKKTFGASSSNVSLINSLSDISTPCIIEEFCPNNDGDIRINVIGNRVMGFKRFNKENDFRASGSGLIKYIEDLPSDCCELAYKISKDNGFDSMAYDFVKNKNGEWVVLEMSYAYMDTAVRDCEYYYDMLSGEKKDKMGIYPEDFILEDLLKLI